MFALFTVFLFSCDDAINVAAGDEIVDENAITNAKDVESATIGAYAAVGGGNSFQWNSAFTDEVNVALSNNGQGVQVHNWSINSGTDEVGAIYNGLFLPISRTNRVLTAMDKVVAANPSEQIKLDRSRGELLFIRALSHFDLLRFFAPSFTDLNAPGIPYVDYVVVLQKPARNTVGEVYTKLDADLTAALSLLPDDYTDNTKATKDAVRALQARIALYKGDYETAITLASGFINNTAKYKLATTAEFPSIWTDGYQGENIFRLKRVTGDGAIGAIYMDNSQTVYFNPSEKLVNLYAPTDVRLNTYLSGDRSTVIKYPGVAGNFGLNDIKLFRLAEMYLIRAEAYAKTSQFGLASNDYNKLRLTRQPSGFTAVTFTNTTDAVNQILEESFREFAFEGFRFFDLKRNGRALVRNANDCATQTNNICSLEAGDYRFALPFPSATLFVNKNIVQNPGY